MKGQLIRKTLERLLNCLPSMALLKKPGHVNQWEVPLEGFNPVGNWGLTLSVSNNFSGVPGLYFSLDEKDEKEKITLFQKRVHEFDIEKLSGWYEEKLEILEEESIKLKELGFRQFRHGEFELDGDEFFLNMSRDTYRLAMASPDGEFEKVIVIFDGIGYGFTCHGSLTDILKEFLRKDMFYEGFILLPQNLRDLVIGEN